MTEFSHPNLLTIYLFGDINSQFGLMTANGEE